MKERKALFIDQLAHFLVDNQAGKSVLLQLEQSRPVDDNRPKLAIEWAKLREKSTMLGYPEHPEAVEILTRLLA